MKRTRRMQVWAMVVLVPALGMGLLAKEPDKAGGRAKVAPRKVMTQFDKDKNGKIEGAEADALRKAFDGDMKKELAAFDRDGNGKLDDAEIGGIRARAASGSGGLPPRKNGEKTKKPGQNAPVE